jgi:hypothetical protein
MKTRRLPLPTYEVEFVPLERRLLERRQPKNFCYIGLERRRDRSRREARSH